MARVALASTPEGSVLVVKAGVLVPASGASAHVYQHGTTTPVPVYEGETGSKELTQPLAVGVTGVLAGFVEPGQRLTLAVSYEGAEQAQLIEAQVGNETILEKARAETEEAVLAAAVAAAVTPSSGPALREGLTWNGSAWEPSRPVLVKQPILTENLTFFASPANNTLAAGHTWALSQEFAAGSELNYTGDGGLNSAQCIKLVTKGTGTFAGASLTRLAELNLKGKHLRFFFKIPPESAATLNSIQVAVGSGAGAFTGQLKNTIVSSFSSTELAQFGKAGEWFSTCVVPYGLESRVGTEINWEKIQDYRVLAEDNKGGPTTILFGGVQVVDNDSRFTNGVLSFTFDDCYGSQWEKLAPMLGKYGYKASLYLTVDAVNASTKLTLEQIQHLQNVQGWDVSVHCDLGAHNVSPETGMTTLTETVILNDLRAAQEKLAEWGLCATNHWAVPSGRFDARFMNFGRELFSSARITGGGGGETVPPADPRRLRIAGMTNASKTGPSSEVGSMKWKIAETKAFGGWMILLIHDVAVALKEPNTLNEKVVEETIEAVHAEGLAVRKVSEVLGV